jgi:hypothetical protein
MVQKHTGTAKSHDFPNLFSIIGSITMNHTARTERLQATLRAMINPGFCIGKQITAFFTECFVAMMFSTVESDHGFHYLLLHGQSILVHANTYIILGSTLIRLS